jgi:hypothetical protein
VEFKIDTTALSISVSAKANKKAGIKVPKNAEIVIHFHWSLLICFNFEKPTNSKNIAANKVRSAPNCNGVRPINPFLIKINELPQTTESTIRYSHFLERLFMCNTSRLRVKNYQFSQGANMREFVTSR